jgi:hypothetical protein
MKTEGKDDLQQIRELCDTILEEEIKTIEHALHVPVGPNIFLALEVPGRNNKEVAYLTLERETENTYMAALYTISIPQLSNPDSGLKRQKVWVIDEQHPEKILTGYAKHYKYLRGE